MRSEIAAHINSLFWVPSNNNCINVIISNFEWHLNIMCCNGNKDVRCTIWMTATDRCYRHYRVWIIITYHIFHRSYYIMNVCGLSAFRFSGRLKCNIILSIDQLKKKIERFSGLSWAPRCQQQFMSIILLNTSTASVVGVEVEGVVITEYNCIILH